jgi:hypothetical protein
MHTHHTTYGRTGGLSTLIPRELVSLFPASQFTRALISVDKLLTTAFCSEMKRLRWWKGDDLSPSVALDLICTAVRRSASILQESRELGGQDNTKYSKQAIHTRKDNEQIQR